MEKIAKFHKVSMQRSEKDWGTASPRTDATEIRRIYETLRLPVRATKGSVDCNFSAPAAVSLKPKGTIKIPTGIRAEVQESWVLQLFPRNSLDSIYCLQFNNTVGIIDSGYLESGNEGHIFTKVTNDFTEGEVVQIHKGDGLVRGIFLPFGICEDDDVQKQRNGDSESTNEQLQDIKSVAFFALCNMCTASTHTHCKYK